MQTEPICQSTKLDIGDTISETTAVHWLKKLGFELSHVQKCFVAVLVAVPGFLRFRVGFHVHTDIA